MISAREKSYPVKVTIVLPTYNQKNYLLSAIQSLLNQTYQNFELIIVNDGSTDETGSFLASIQHPKVRVITQTNQGLPEALNSGFAAARGEYWTWTSTDNIVSPLWLEKLVNALDESPKEVGYAFSFYAVIDDHEKILYVHREQRFDLPSLLMRHYGNASFLYRAELAKKVGPYDPQLKYAEDLDMWVRMAELTQAVLVESVLYYYRVHANSMTTQQDKVREATKRVVTKYLAKTDGKFDIDKLFPSIQLSPTPEVERFRARLWLITLGVNASFYCPIEALIDQLVLALKEHYETALIANLIHLFIKRGNWNEASHVLTICQRTDASDFLKQLADIVMRRDKTALQQIPFVAINENVLALNCNGSHPQRELLRNLTSQKIEKDKAISFESIVTDLMNQLEDQKDHPEVWLMISQLQSPEEKQMLNQFRFYLLELMNAPQDPAALILLEIVEAVCHAYTSSVELAMTKLEKLIQRYPHLLIVKGALNYICHRENVYVTESNSVGSA